MPTIDGHSAVGNNPNLQPAHDDIDTSSAEAGRRQVVLSADGQAYLKTGGSAPVPAFAGPPQVDREQAGKAALQVMHKHVRADANQLSSAWPGAQGSSFGINYSELIEVLVKLDSEQAKASREARTFEYKEIAATQMQGADDLRKAGQLEFIGGMVSSSLTMAAGAAAIGSAASTMGGEAEGTGAATEAAGESIEGASAETSVSPGEEEEATTSFTEGTGIGDVEGPDPAADISEDLGADETTADTEAELEEAAAKADSGESAGDAGETEASADADETAEQEQELTEQRDKLEQKEQRNDLLDDDTKKIMKQFSRDTRANAKSQSSQAKLSIGTGLSQGIQGMGSAGKSIADLGASDLRAKAKEEEATASEQQAVMQQETDYGKSAEENAKKMMDVYDAIAQSRDASMQRVVSA